MSLRSAFSFRKKYFCILLFASFWGLPGLSHGSISKNLHLEWSYDTSLQGLAGYRIYLGNVMVKEVNDPKALTSGIVVDLESGINLISMSAFSQTGGFRDLMSLRDRSPREGVDP